MSADDEAGFGASLPSEELGVFKSLGFLFWHALNPQALESSNPHTLKRLKFCST